MEKSILDMYVWSCWTSLSCSMDSFKDSKRVQNDVTPSGYFLQVIGPYNVIKGPAYEQCTASFVVGLMTLFLESGSHLMSSLGAYPLLEVLWWSFCSMDACTLCWMWWLPLTVEPPTGPPPRKVWQDWGSLGGDIGMCGWFTGGGELPQLLNGGDKMDWGGDSTDRGGEISPL